MSAVETPGYLPAGHPDRAARPFEQGLLDLEAGVGREPADHALHRVEAVDPAGAGGVHASIAHPGGSLFEAYRPIQVLADDDAAGARPTSARIAFWMRPTVFPGRRVSVEGSRTQGCLAMEPKLRLANGGKYLPCTTTEVPQ